MEFEEEITAKATTLHPDTNGDVKGLEGWEEDGGAFIEREEMNMKWVSFIVFQSRCVNLCPKHLI